MSNDQQRGREALARFLLIMVGGALVLALLDRLIGINAEVGNVAFIALPIVAVTAAVNHLERRHEGRDRGAGDDRG